MKELLAEVKGAFSGAGSRKKRNSFWKREGGFYRLVDFQPGPTAIPVLSMLACTPLDCHLSLPESW